MCVRRGREQRTNEKAEMQRETHRLYKTQGKKEAANRRDGRRAGPGRGVRGQGSWLPGSSFCTPPMSRPGSLRGECAGEAQSPVRWVPAPQRCRGRVRGDWQGELGGRARA